MGKKLGVYLRRSLARSYILAGIWWWRLRIGWRGSVFQLLNQSSWLGALLRLGNGLLRDDSIALDVLKDHSWTGLLRASLHLRLIWLTLRLALHTVLR